MAVYLVVTMLLPPDRSRACVKSADLKFGDDQVFDMPMEHWTFYGKTVERLVAAGKLPREVQEDFEAANHDVVFRIMA